MYFRAAGPKERRHASRVARVRLPLIAALGAACVLLSTGCEVDTRVRLDHCGACFSVCSRVASCDAPVAWMGVTTSTFRDPTHEAAHVVQQGAGVFLKDGLGDTGDLDGSRELYPDSL